MTSNLIGMRFAARFRTVSLFALTLVIAGLDVGAVQLGAPGAPASLDDLLRKAREASGAPYRYHVVSRSHDVEDGHAYDVTTETDGLAYRARKCVRDLCVSGFYFDGERSFESNFNDTALPLSTRVDALQISLRAIASYAFTAPNFRSDGGQLFARDDVLRDGKAYRRVAVAPRLGALLDAVIDPASGLVVGVISDERRLAFEFGDQRKVGGFLTLPFSVSLNGNEIERFDDRRIETAPLTAPPGLVPRIATGGSPAIAMNGGDQPVVPCTLGRRSAACLLDTGNSGLAISAEFAAKLRLRVESSDLVGTAGGAVAGIAKAPALQVGPASFGPAWYVVLGAGRASGYDVVLGADAFAHARVSIDFPGRRVTFASDRAPLSGGHAIEFDSFVPTLGVSLGSTAATLAVDTGEPAELELGGDFASAHPAAVAASGLRIGDEAVDRVRIETAKHLSTPGDGLLGSGFLHRFVTVFDYAHERIALNPS
jgi:hypothetical protein